MQKTKMWLVLPEQYLYINNIHVSNIYNLVGSAVFLLLSKLCALARFSLSFKRAVNGFHAPNLSPQ